MANQKLSALTTIPAVDRAADLLYIVDNSGGTSNKVTPNVLLGISGDPVGTTDTQVLTGKTLTSPTISSPTLSGTLTGTYTLGGTPTFPASVVTLTGAQTLTNKILTSPTINTATISNPTLNTDTVNEFTSGNGVTIDGLNIKDSKLNTNNSVVTANVTDAAITPPKWTNTYKFRVYRTAAENIATGPAVVLFDTKSYDTSSNVDVVTNQGRFTAPVSGFYQFNARVSSGAATTIAIIHLYKNGSAIARGSDIRSSVSTAGLTINDCIQLSANDYVEVYAQFNTTVALEVGSGFCYFSGFLVSVT